jgi:transcriptional antiterminator RfaH
LAQHAAAYPKSGGGDSMNKRTAWDAPFWYVIHTHPKQEDRADGNLSVLGVQTFNPKVRERRYNQYADTSTYLVKPLFPGYIFARFKINDLYHKIRFTRGVHSLISFGDAPTAIDEEIIEVIQSNIREDGLVSIEDTPKPGDKVIIQHGPLRNFAGIFEREMKGADRVRILLQTVSYQAHVEIEKGLVVKLNTSGSQF